MDRIAPTEITDDNHRNDLKGESHSKDDEFQEANNSGIMKKFVTPHVGSDIFIFAFHFH